MSPRIALVGDFNAKNRTHLMTNAALEQLGAVYEWVATDEVGVGRLSSYQGIWVAPASPYRSMDGALEALRYARERQVPLVGT
jgi:CTP synthase (UTP-ammonia lyase)